MLRVFKAQAISYFAHGFAGIEYLFLGYIHQFGLNVLLRRFACLLFYHISTAIECLNKHYL